MININEQTLPPVEIPEQSLASIQSPVPEEIGLEVYAQDNPNEVGLGTGNTNQFYSERTGLLWNEINDVRGTELSQSLVTARETLDRVSGKVSQLEMVQASKSALKMSKEAMLAQLEDARVANDKEAADFSTAGAQYLASLEVKADAFPQETIALATAERLAPDQPMSVKDTIAFKEYQNGTVAQRMGDQGFLSWGTDNYLADAAALFLIPGRTLAGQMDVGNSAWFGSYYTRLKLWNQMSLADQSREWKQLEQDIADASGDNKLVYASLILPFVDKDDAIWAKIDSGLDITAVGATLFAGVRLYKAIGVLSKYQKVRSTANLAGNPNMAGKLVTAEIKRGNPEAIVEGHPVNLPDQAETAPNLVPDVAYPTQNTLVEELIANGIIRDGAGDIPVADIPRLNDSEAALAAEKRRQLVGDSGEIVSETIDDVGMEITLRKPSLVEKPESVVRKERAELRKEIKARRAELAVALADGNAEKAKVLLGAVETAVAQDKALTKAINTSKAMKKSGIKVTSLKVPGGPEEVKVRFNWTVDDVGLLNFEEADIGIVGHYMGSQELRLDKILKGQSALGTFISAQQRGLLGHIFRKEKQIRSTLRGNNPLTSGVLHLAGKNEVRRVDSVLLRGDELQTTFSDTQLLEGIETSEGLLRLNEREIQAYKDTRDLYNSLWRMLNKTRRDDLAFAGQSSFRVNHVSKDGTLRKVNVFGKGDEFSTNSPMHRDVLGTDIRATHVIDGRSGDVVEISTVVDLEKDIAAGKRAYVKLKEPFIQGDGKYYNYVLVDIEKVGAGRKAKQALDLPEQVLEYRNGYVPKIVATPVNFVVEQTADMIVNGAKVRDTRVLRGFRNRAEADAFVEQKTASYLDRLGGPPEPDSGPMSWVVNDLNENYRRNNPEKMEFINSNLFHGAFGGHRTDGTFKVGLDGEVAVRQSAYESLRLYGDFVARNAPMHQYKSSMIRRFLNSIKDQASGKSMLDVPWDWTSKITLANSDPRYKGAKAMQDWMKATFAVPISEERQFERFTRTLAHSLDRIIYKDKLGNKRWGASLALKTQEKLTASRWAKDPFQAAKGFTFDMMLGMFNPAQAVIQSAGMAVPLSLHPIEGVMAMPKFGALRGLWQMSNVDDAALAAKAMGLSEHEFRPMWQAFRRSGIPESVIENADFGHYVTSQHGYYSTGMLTKLRETGRMFYTLGELNNRTFAWTMGYERMMKEHGWSRVAQLTDKQLQIVNEEALRIGMNMTQANRAAWQQGIGALPTQFMQVTAKYYENLFAGFFNVNKGGKWSRQEAFTSFFYSTLAFGAAGWSADELIADFENYLTDPQGPFALDREKNKDVLAAAKGGFMEMVAGRALGWTPDISDRIALGSGINMIAENIVTPMIDFFFKGDVSGLPKMMLGASYTMNTRVHNAVASTWELFSTDIVTGNFTEEQVLRATLEVAQVASSGSNLLKAYTWANANDVVIPGTGERLGMVPAGSTIDPTVLALKALGFDPLALEEYYTIDRKSKEYDKLKTEISGQVSKELRALYLDTGLLENPETRKAAQARMAVWVQRLDEGDREDVLNRAIDILDEDPKTEKLIEKIFNRLMNMEEGSDEARAASSEMQALESKNLSTKE